MNPPDMARREALYKQLYLYEQQEGVLPFTQAQRIVLNVLVEEAIKYGQSHPDVEPAESFFFEQHQRIYTVMYDTALMEAGRRAAYETGKSIASERRGSATLWANLRRRRPPEVPWPILWR